jgi:hypothetical protein
MPKPATFPPLAQLKVQARRIAANVLPPIRLPGRRPLKRSHEQQSLAECIVETVLRVRDRDRRSTGQIVGTRLRGVAGHAKRLREAYSRLSQQDRDRIEHIKNTQAQFTAGAIQNVDATICNLSSLIHTALGKTTPIPKPLKRDHKYALYQELGMLGPKANDQMLRELVFGLLHSAKDAGGELTFDKNNESGSLATTLRGLRDGGHLPPGLVKDPLQSSMIQRLKSEFSRLNA